MGNRLVFKRIIEIVASIVAIVGLLVIFRNFWQEIVSIVLGYAVARIGINIIFTAHLLHEDADKICTKNFNYDEGTYKHLYQIKDKKMDLWFESVTDPTKEAAYEMADDPAKNFQVDTFIQTHFTQLVDAHQASYIENKKMIRLDDCEAKEDGVYLLKTGRTVFFNDLLTNRMMDYKFHGDLTLRALYEPGNFLTPLSESKLSNHIGINVLIFCGDKILFPCRSGAATQTKNGVTSGIAIGLSEADVIKAIYGGGNHLSEIKTHEVFEQVIFDKLKGFTTFDDEALKEGRENGKIKFYNLGFCRLIANGGKPQFYYAICVDESMEDKFVLQKKEWSTQKAIDAVRFYVFADGIELTKKGNDRIKLLGAKAPNGRQMVRKAEPSFFVNMWYLTQQEKKEGVPQWVYEN